MSKELDEIDIEILEILEKNAKTRIHIIAKKLGIPSSTIHHRIKRLEKEEIIKNWSINKNYKNLGLKLKVYILVFIDVTLLKRMKKTQKDLAKEIRKIGNVEGVDIITGDADILVTVRCRDIEDLQKTLLGKMQGIEGITKTKTMIVVVES